MTITYVPTALREAIRSGHRNVMKRNAELYCHQCRGEIGGLSDKYGNLILEDTINQLNLEIAKHPADHSITLVEISCGGGIF